MTTKEFTSKTVWDHRWEYSLEPSILQARKKTKNNSIKVPEKTSPLKTIDSTLEGLRRFAAAQISLFSDLFASNHKYFEPAPLVYPKEWVMRTTIDQISYDLDVLQRATSQRIGTAVSPAHIKFLDLADKYAYNRCLKPAINLGIIEETTAITYFHKNPKVRVIPYAPVALVGMPFTIINVLKDSKGVYKQSEFEQSLANIDFVATAHEIGHYIYHHGIIPQREQKNDSTKNLPDHEGIKRTCKDVAAEWDKNHPDLPNKIRPWIEEIFADIYGCLIAGPIIAYAFITLQIDNNPQKIATSDGRHPPAILRPLTYIKMLELMGNQEDADLLKIVWKQWWHQWSKEETPQTPDAKRRAAIIKFVKTFSKGEANTTCDIGTFIEDLLDRLLIDCNADDWPGSKIKLCSDLPDMDEDNANALESNIRALNKCVVKLMKSELKPIRKTTPNPSLNLVGECTFEKPCSWELDQRTGKFWHSNTNTKELSRSEPAAVVETEEPLITVGTPIGPKPEPGIQALIEVLKNRKAVDPLIIIEAPGTDPAADGLIEADLWKDIFLMNGWNTGGPEEDATG